MSKKRFVVLADRPQGDDSESRFGDVTGYINSVFNNLEDAKAWCNDLVGVNCTKLQVVDCDKLADEGGAIVYEVSYEAPRSVPVAEEAAPAQRPSPPIVNRPSARRDGTGQGGW